MKVRVYTAMLTVGLSAQAVLPALADSPCSAAAKALQKASSYESTLVVRHGNQIGLQGTTDIEKPNSIHVIEPHIEMIGIGSQGWMRMNGGPWQKSPVAMGSLASMDPSTFVKTKRTTTCVDAGMGAWHGQSVRVYKETYTASDGSGAQATMYVGTDGLIRHLEYQSSRSNGSIDFSKFNAVTIAPP